MKVYYAEVGGSLQIDILRKDGQIVIGQIPLVTLMNAMRAADPLIIYPCGDFEAHVNRPARYGDRLVLQSLATPQGLVLASEDLLHRTMPISWDRIFKPDCAGVAEL